MIKVSYSKKINNVIGIQSQENSDDFLLSWRYHKTMDFLLIISSIQNAQNAVQEILEKINDNQQVLLEDGSLDFGGYQVYFLRETEFSMQDRKWRISKNTVRNLLPAVVQVFACELDGEDIIVYKASGKEKAYFPFDISVNARYKRKWFSRNKVCFFYISDIKNFENSSIYYTISDLPIQYPLTEQCLRKELSVLLPKNERLDFKVAEDYKNIYRIKESLR